MSSYWIRTTYTFYEIEKRKKTRNKKNKNCRTPPQGMWQTLDYKKLKRKTKQNKNNTALVNGVRLPVRTKGK